MKTTNWWSILYILALTVLMAQNYLLVQKNDKHMLSLEKLNARLAERESIQIGDSVYLSDIRGGDTTTTGLYPQVASESILLFVFTTHCQACRENVGQWKELVKKVKGQGQLQIFGISPDSIHLIEKFRVELGLDVPAYSYQNNEGVIERLRLTHFPQTILFSSGKVSNIWAGLLSDRRRKEIEQAIANLPLQGEFH